MSKIIVGWTLRQAVAFLVLWCLVCGPWVYFVLAASEAPK